VALFCEGFINIFFGESPYIYHYHLLFSDFYAAEIVISIRSPCWEKHTEKLSWVYPPGMFCCFHGRLFDAKRTKNREVVQTHMGLVLEQLMDLMDLVDLVVMGPFLCGNHLGSRIVG
jgi:hypothetical protein